MCLKGYIGINYCESETTESGIYINQLAGISLKSIDNIANDEHINFLGVWNHVEDRAIRRLNSKANSIFSSKYQTKKVLSNIEVNRNVSDLIITNGSYRGLRLYNQSVSSELASIYIQCLWLYSETEVLDADIFIENKFSNIIYSKKFNLSEGWNKLRVYQVFSETELIIYYDDSQIQSKNLILEENNTNCSCENNCSSDCQLEVSGFQRNNNLDSIVNNTFGLSVIASLRCSIQSIICNNIDIFQSALLYALGLEFAYERMYSDRINRYTKLDAKEAESLFVDYLNEFNNSIQDAINSIYVKDDDVCIVCNSIISQSWLKT